VQLEPAAEPRQADVVDLMERMRRSLAQTGSKGTAARGGGAKTAKPKRAGRQQKRRTRHAA